MKQAFFSCENGNAVICFSELLHFYASALLYIVFVKLTFYNNADRGNAGLRLDFRSFNFMIETKKG